MNKSLYGLMIFSLLSLGYGCSPQVYPPYSETAKLLELKTGLEIKEVESLLGIPVYNVYFADQLGHQILTFHYRTRQRTLDDTPVRQKQLAKNLDKGYYAHAHRLVAHFAQGKLVDYFTESAALPEDVDGAVVFFGLGDAILLKDGHFLSTRPGRGKAASGSER